MFLTTPLYTRNRISETVDNNHWTYMYSVQCTHKCTRTRAHTHTYVYTLSNEHTCQTRLVAHIKLVWVTIEQQKIVCEQNQKSFTFQMLNQNKWVVFFTVHQKCMIYLYYSTFHVYSHIVKSSFSIHWFICIVYIVTHTHMHRHIKTVAISQVLWGDFHFFFVSLTKREYKN